MRKLALVSTAIALAVVPASLIAPAQAADSYDVSLSASRTAFTYGAKVTFSGTISPKAAGQEIRVQFYDTGQGGPGWATWRKGTVRSDGTYKQNFTPKADRRKWRIYKPASNGAGAGVSRSVTLRPYQWYKLASNGLQSGHVVVASGAQYLNAHGPVDVAGKTVTTYFQSNADGSGTTRWYTQRLCKQLRVDVGLADTSADGAASQFRVFAASKKIVSEKVTKGSMTAVDVPFSESGTPWLRFTTENRVDAETYLTASNPRMLCSFYDDLG